MKCKYCKNGATHNIAYIGSYSPNSDHTAIVCKEHWHKLYGIKVPKYIPKQQIKNWKIKHYKKENI